MGLVLTRKERESITLFDKLDGSVLPVVITLEKVSGNRGWLNIDAPPHIGIVRTELIKRVCNDAESNSLVPADARTEKAS